MPAVLPIAELVDEKRRRWETDLREWWYGYCRRCERVTDADGNRLLVRSKAKKTGRGGVCLECFE